MEYIKMEPPTWKTAIEIYMAVLENGTEEGKVSARAELRRLAECVDQINADNKRMRMK